MPVNGFRKALLEGRTQIGLWVGMGDANAAEALAGTGYDWLLFDGEHAPSDVRTVLDQLRAAAPYPCHPVVRPVQGDTALVKQYLDIGAQTLLVPMVESAGQAAALVRAMRYPPRGIRGVGATLARASRCNQVDSYLDEADDQMCLVVQAETPAALAQLQAIAAVDGVDDIFFGPADLSAAMGLRGQPGHPAGQQAILDGIATVRAAGRAAGALMADTVMARRCLDAGASFVAVGVDTTLLVRAARELLQGFRPAAGAAVPAGEQGAPDATPNDAGQGAW